MSQSSLLVHFYTAVDNNCEPSASGRSCDVAASASVGKPLEDMEDLACSSWPWIHLHTYERKRAPGEEPEIFVLSGVRYQRGNVFVRTRMLCLTHLAWWRSIGLSWSPWQHCSIPGPYQNSDAQGKVVDFLGQGKRKERRWWVLNSGRNIFHNSLSGIFIVKGQINFLI